MSPCLTLGISFSPLLSAASLMNIWSAGGWRIKDKDINRGHERLKGAKEGSRKGNMGKAVLPAPRPHPEFEVISEQKPAKKQRSIWIHPFKGPSVCTALLLKKKTKKKTFEQPPGNLTRVRFM